MSDLHTPKVLNYTKDIWPIDQNSLNGKCMNSSIRAAVLIKCINVIDIRTNRYGGSSGSTKVSIKSGAVAMDLTSLFFPLFIGAFLLESWWECGPRSPAVQFNAR